MIIFRKPTYIMLFITMFFSSVALGKPEIITATHKYLMGDNDSKNDARRMCFLEAKRKVLEKSGTYIETATNVKNFQLTKDEINVYSAALLKVETISEVWDVSNSRMSVTIEVKALVDTKYIEAQLSKIKNDTSLQNKIKNQQYKLKNL